MVENKDGTDILQYESSTKMSQDRDAFTEYGDCNLPIVCVGGAEK